MSGLRGLVAAQLVGNAALMAAAYYWLGVGESDALHLLMSAALVAAVLFGGAWVHGGTMAHFRNEPHPLRAIAANPFTRWLPLVALTLLALAVYFAAEYWDPVTEDRVNRLSSYLTLTLQRPVRPATVERALGWLWWVVEWVALPVLLAPLASAVAERGWIGFAEVGRGLRRWSLWLLIPAILLLAVWAPLRLMAWTPAMSGFAMETVSLVARFGLAYLLFVGGAMALAFVTSRGKPDFSQPTTAVSP